MQTVYIQMRWLIADNTNGLYSDKMAHNPNKTANKTNSFIQMRWLIIKIKQLSMQTAYVWMSWLIMR